ncbi:MAG: hypothetical protein ABSB60_13370 [Terracidiphilus sp.]|jgi:hypothetical protein
MLPVLATAALAAIPEMPRMQALVFSALNAPYAGSMTVIYSLYPNRFAAKDAVRIGTYSLLEYMSGNIALGFFYMGLHTPISRMRLNNAHGSPIPGPNQ